MGSKDNKRIMTVVIHVIVCDVYIQCVSSYCSLLFFSVFFLSCSCDLSSSSSSSTDFITTQVLKQNFRAATPQDLCFAVTDVKAAFATFLFLRCCLHCRDPVKV